MKSAAFTWLFVLGLCCCLTVEVLGGDNADIPTTSGLSDAVLESYERDYPPMNHAIYFDEPIPPKIFDGFFEETKNAMKTQDLPPKNAEDPILSSSFD